MATHGERKKDAARMKKRNSSGIQTDNQLFKRFGRVKEHLPFVSKAKDFAKSKLSFSATKAKKVLHSLLPATAWIPRYKVRDNLLGDIAAGATVGIVHLPQGMAYASLASMPAVTGLYVSFFPVLIYALFGTSRHLSVGTFAVVCLMIGAVIDQQVPDVPCDGGDVNGTLSSVMTSLTDHNVTAHLAAAANMCPNNARKVEVAVALSVAVAIVNFLMYVMRLGFVTVYLSSHMVSGFTCGAAIHVMTSQVPKLIGVHVPRHSGPLAIVYTYIELFTNIKTINWATTIISLISIIFIMIGKEINLRYKKKIRFPIPWELFVVIFTTLASRFAYLSVNYDVSVVGEIPTGVQLTTPAAADIGALLPSSIAISVVGYAITISLARMFATKHAYDVDSNQELLAFGFANLFGSFFSCFPCSTSLSRSVIWEEAGGNSQVTGLVSSAVVLLVLLWIGPLFETLPAAGLAAIIVVNLKRLLRQFDQLPALWKVSKLDATIWIVTWLAVVLLGVDVGLLAGVAVSLLCVTIRTQNATGDVMIPVSKNRLYRSSSRFFRADKNEDDEGCDHVLIFRYASPLHFANKEGFKKQLTSALGFDPATEGCRRRKNAKRRASSMAHTEKDAVLPMTTAGYVNTIVLDEPSPSSSSLNYTSSSVDNVTMTSTGDDISRSVSLAIDGCDVDGAPFCLILDMRSCSFLDNDGVKTLRSLYTDLKQLDVQLLLAECPDEVAQTLIRGDFPTDNYKDDGLDDVFFVSLEAADAFARNAVIKRLETFDAKHSRENGSAVEAPATDGSPVDKTAPAYSER